MQTRPDEAIDEIERGLAAVPDDPALWVALAGVHLRLQSTRPAGTRGWSAFDRCYAKAVELAGPTPAVSLMLVDRFALGGKPEESLRVLEKAAKEAPRSASLAVALADALVRLGRQADAKRLLEWALQPDAVGDQPSVRIALAHVLSAMNHVSGARTVLRKDMDSMRVKGSDGTEKPADRPASDRIQLWMALAELETAQGNTEGAEQAYREWQKITFDDPRPFVAVLDLTLERAEKDEKGKNAVKAAFVPIDQRFRYKDGTSDIAYRLATREEDDFRSRVRSTRRRRSRGAKGRRRTKERRGGRAPGGVEARRFCPVGGPRPSRGGARQGPHHRPPGRPDEAIATYERAWKRGTEEALEPMIELMAARKHYDALARLRADAGAAQVDLLSSKAFLHLGDADQASRIAQNVARELPDSPEVLGWQARVLNVLGRFEDAESALRDGRTPARRARAVARFAQVPGEAQAESGRRRDDRADQVGGQDRPPRPSQRPLPLGGRRRDARVVGRRQGVRRGPRQARRRRDPAAGRQVLPGHRPARPRLALLEKVVARDPGNRPAARELAVALSARADDKASWDRALKVLGTVGDDSPPEDRLAQAVVSSRAPDADNAAGPPIAPVMQINPPLYSASSLTSIAPSSFWERSFIIVIN